MYPDLLKSACAKHFALGFLDMVMTWNAVEGEARNLLLSPAKLTFGAYAAVMQLGNVALTNAIYAQAEYMGGDWRKHLEHFAKCVERQRDYRNYYVHSISALGIAGDKKRAAAMLTTIDAKPLIRHSQASVSDTRIWEFAKELETLRLYGVRLNARMRSEFRSPKEPPPAWPDKPPLPAQIKKTRTHLPGHPPPPQS